MSGGGLWGVLRGAAEIRSHTPPPLQKKQSQGTSEVQWLSYVKDVVQCPVGVWAQVRGVSALGVKLIQQFCEGPTSCGCSAGLVHCRVWSGSQSILAAEN